MINHTPPRYIVNPAALTGTRWFPAGIRGVILHFKNPSYLNSVWLGFWLPPQVAISGAISMVSNVFNFRFGSALSNLVAIPALALLFVLKGLAGQLRVLPLPMDVLRDCLILSPGDVDKLDDAHAKVQVFDTSMMA